MNDVIQLLPDSVANQIAAGEVIQRPASVVKELVENAVDAGASHINVLVVDAGRTSIQVIDNGKGMSETDARLAFERHATSKIRKADDLFALHTMGFRGEALASIAAVAQIELKTRQVGEDIGTMLTLAASRFTGQEPCSCPVGSNFKIENLFFNLPARRKFLKTNTTELNNIITAFERIVLVYPDVSFSLHSNGVEMMSLKAGNIRQRIVDVFGKKINQDLLPVEVDTTLCKIHGYVGKPESSKKKGALQYFFVNNRFMKHPYFHKAVISAFERLLPAGEQIPYFLYFDVPAENIDVNIHPTKTEIKFENEQAVWQILLAGVKEAIGRFNDIPTIDFDNEGKPDIPVFSPNLGTAVPKISYNPQYNPFKETPTSSSSKSEWEKLYASLPGGTKDSDNQNIPLEPQNEQVLFESDEASTATNSVFEDKSPIHYQYKGRYVMTAVKSGLMLIDQHRAHVRVLYESYLRRMQERKTHTQKLLFPEMINFSPQDDMLLRDVLPEIQNLGFDLSSMGSGSYAVNGVPSGIEGLNVATLIPEMLVALKETNQKPGESVNQSLAHTLARSAAIPQGQILSNEEMENLVNQLFVCENVNYTPDGHPIIAIIKQSEIEHLFGKD